LDEVRGQIEHWRKTRPNRERMPAHLWEAAVALAEEYGIYAISRGLRVNYGGLKARVDGAAKAERTRSAKGRVVSEFIELVPAVAMGSPTGTTVMELVGASGDRLIVRVAGAASADVVALIRELYNRPSWSR
jgi:hypothetical protein